MQEYLSLVDFIVPVIFLIAIYFFAKRRQLRNIEENPSYKYYITGLMVKIAGGIAVCLVYVIYYGGGDTLNYYSDCVVLLNMGEKSILNIFRFLVGPDPGLAFELDSNTGYMQYYDDPHARAVVKLTFLLCFVSRKYAF